MFGSLIEEPVCKASAVVSADQEYAQFNLATSISACRVGSGMRSRVDTSDRQFFRRRQIHPMTHADEDRPDAVRVRKTSPIVSPLSMSGEVDPAATAGSSNLPMNKLLAIPTPRDIQFDREPPTQIRIAADDASPCASKQITPKECSSLHSASTTAGPSREGEEAGDVRHVRLPDRVRDVDDAFFFAVINHGRREDCGFVLRKRRIRPGDEARQRIAERRNDHPLAKLKLLRLPRFDQLFPILIVLAAHVTF